MGMGLKMKSRDFATGVRGLQAEFETVYIGVYIGGIGRRLAGACHADPSYALPTRPVGRDGEHTMGRTGMLQVVRHRHSHCLLQNDRSAIADWPEPPAPHNESTSLEAGQRW